ncbi:MAG: Holliday junction branch migration protein RuvA [Phycisphaerales bacterium]
MICGLTGELVEVTRGIARIRAGALVYEVLLPAFDVERLEPRLGETIELHTKQFLESQGQGNTMIPRLIGFSSAVDRAFFDLFTSVKGIGPRKALRAMAMPPVAIAAAIAGRDVVTLQTLPEIGKRTAETIVAELHGKVDPFVDDAVGQVGAATDRGGASAAAAAPRVTLIREAVSALVALGEPRQQAAQLVDRVLRDAPELTDADEVITAVYRTKGA